MAADRITRGDYAAPAQRSVAPPGRLAAGNVLIAERPDGSLACHLVAPGHSPRALAERLAKDARFIAVGLGQLYEVKRGAGGSSPGNTNSGGSDG